jgi:hypothetical protein
MKFVDIESVEPGDFLGKTIYSANGTVLLSSGVQLTVYMISTLKRIGVTHIYLKNPAAHRAGAGLKPRVFLRCERRIGHAMIGCKL